MKFFTKNEAIGVFFILFLIIAISLYNFRISLRKARDAQRRADLGLISNALGRYNDDFGFFPPASPDGKIKACKDETFEEKVSQISVEDKLFLAKFFDALSPCEWGKDSLRDLSDEKFPPYLLSIPKDPRASEGLSYTYLSNSSRFQIFAHLEGEEEEEGYNAQIVARGIHCGIKICNFGKAYGETPLEKSIEEYENELLRQIQNSP